MTFIFHVWQYDKTYLAITYFDSMTAVDDTGWSAVVSSGVFAQWLIVPCDITSKGFMFVFRHND